MGTFKNLENNDSNSVCTLKSRLIHVVSSSGGIESTNRKLVILANVR